VKRFAASEPVFVTDRGRPTHVLLSIAAYRRLSGERQSILDLIGAPTGSVPLTPPAAQARLGGSAGR
jgi:prevent-host-death family protein